MFFFSHIRFLGNRLFVYIYAPNLLYLRKHRILFRFLKTARQYIYVTRPARRLNKGYYNSARLRKKKYMKSYFRPLYYKFWKRVIPKLRRVLYTTRPFNYLKRKRLVFNYLGFNDVRFQGRVAKAQKQRKKEMAIRKKYIRVFRANFRRPVQTRRGNFIPSKRSQDPIRNFIRYGYNKLGFFTGTVKPMIPRAKLHKVSRIKKRQHNFTQKGKKIVKGTTKNFTKAVETPKNIFAKNISGESIAKRNKSLKNRKSAAVQKKGAHNYYDINDSRFFSVLLKKGSFFSILRKKNFVKFLNELNQQGGLLKYKKRKKNVFGKKFSSSRKQKKKGVVKLKNDLQGTKKQKLGGKNSRELLVAKQVKPKKMRDLLAKPVLVKKRWNLPYRFRRTFAKLMKRKRYLRKRGFRLRRRVYKYVFYNFFFEVPLV